MFHKTLVCFEDSNRESNLGAGGWVIVLAEDPSSVPNLALDSEGICPPPPTHTHSKW